MNRKKRVAICLAAFVALTPMLFMDRSLHAQQFDESLFKAMKWREIGPFRGGRVLAVAGVPADPNVYYFGGVAGGIWKTTDGGETWVPLFDRYSVSSIGSIAVAQSDPNIVYVGTGEACIRGNISFGDGVYKSTDGGKTWQNIGLRDTRHIGRVIVHPRNPDVLFVAALGHAYGPNSERGIFRSADGGKTWEKVLYKDDRTGGIDITFDPSNPSILFAALWESYRTPWTLSSGGPGSGLYKSTNGGTTWRQLEGNGLPKGDLGRIGVTVSASDANRVYALIEAEDGGLYRSDDGGEKWTRTNDEHRFRQRAWYFTHVFADPKNVDTVYILNTGLFRSTDGGQKFSLLPAPHGDHHGLWIDPTNPRRMINGNDGGATITVDGGKTWTRQDNQPTAQFYHVIADNRFPYYVYGAQQDNSTVAIASRTDHGLIDRSDWYPVGGCESGYIAPHPLDADIVYAGCYGGRITRFEKRTGQVQDVSPWPENVLGYGAGELKHRLQWTAPLVISPHDPNVVYHGLEVLFKSTNGGMSWTAISSDLTRNDKSKQGRSGGPITKDNTSVEYYDVIFTIAESPRQKDLIWVGTDDGLVHLTRDGGKNWANVTPKNFLEWSMVSLIEASPHDAATAYMAVDRHKLDDYRPHVYKTGDFGKTWTKITNGIPENTYVHAVREDPKKRGLLYAGTETGVFVSFDGGARWQPLRLNLPTTPIHDLIVKDDDLVVATHGRSFWILDDLSPLRQLSDRVANSEVHLYTPRPAYRMRGLGGVVRRGPVGENAPDGAILYYYLKSAATQEITLEILNGQGKLVRRFSSRETPVEEQPEEWPDIEKAKERLPAEAGMNRFVWDLRHEGPSIARGAVFEGGEAPKGPLAPPGTYHAKLTATGRSLTVPLEIRLDARVSTSQADLDKQFDLLMRTRERVTQAHDIVNQLRELRSQLQGLRKRLGKEQRGEAIITAAEQLDKRMTAVEEELIQVKTKASEDSLNYPVKLNEKFISLGRAIEIADTAPTQQSYDVFDMLSQELDAQLLRWNEIQTKDLVALSTLIQKENIPLLSVAPGSKTLGNLPP